MTGRLPAITALVLALVTTAAGVMPALAATPDPFMGSPFNQNQVLAYRWGSGAVPTTAIKTAINAAANDANAIAQEQGADVPTTTLVARTRSRTASTSRAA